MLGIRWRAFLPIAHTVLDLVVLAAWIWHGRALASREQGSAPSPRATLSVLSLQEESSERWDPPARSSPEFMLLASAALPAGILSVYLRPDSGTQRPGRFWDPTWLLIHEIAAALIWFLIGLWTETGNSILPKAMRLYLFVRCALVLLDVTVGGAAKGSVLQFLFWVWLAGFGLVSGFRRLVWLAGRVRA